MPIPSGTKFIGISANVDTLERKSALANSPSQVYTIDDIYQYVFDNLPPEPKYQEVIIDSSQILSMGSSPIELLEAPGEGYYNVIDNIVIEYGFVTSAYIFPASPTFYLDGCFDAYIDKTLLTSSTNTVCSISANLRNTITVGSGSGSVKLITNKDILNSNLIIGTTNGDNPTTGDGYMVVKITYTTNKSSV